MGGVWGVGCEQVGGGAVAGTPPQCEDLKAVVPSNHPQATHVPATPTLQVDVASEDPDDFGHAAAAGEHRKRRQHPREVPFRI